MCRHSAPTIQRSEQALDGILQYRGVGAHVTGFPERLVDDRVERDSAPNKLAALRLGVRSLRPCRRERAGKSDCDLGRQIGK
jgi:hypothetical protein